MHKNAFMCVLAVTILALKVKYRSFGSENMRHELTNSNSCRNQKLCIYVQQKYRENVVLAVIFCFTNFKVEDTRYRMLSDSNSAHTNYVKKSL